MIETKKDNLLIVGGGIGGLAAALGAAKAGVSSVVFEQASKFGEVGAGIQLGPNAMKALDYFGLLNEIDKVAVYPKRLVLKDIYTGKELSVLDLGDSFKKRYGYSYTVLHRSDLQKILHVACLKTGSIELLNNQSIQEVNETANRVTIKNQHGKLFSGKALIGADGLKSNIRKVFSDDEPICSEYVAYRGTIPTSEIENANMEDVIMWIGPNLHLVQYPVRRKELYNLVVVFKSYNYKADSDDWGTPEEMEKRFAGCHPLAHHALQFIQRQIRWPMYDRLPIDNWTKGNITLLGDAAHPMLQYLAQGGCQALEDAAYLAEMLETQAGNYHDVFQAYQEKRIPRTAQVQTSARLWGEIIHAIDPIPILLRDAIFEQRTPKDYEIVDFLYASKGIKSKLYN
ncbi:3-hydroxybenzoate 6-hydroxylase [Fictibacillus arsenicus]|uniref:3-hydroxybenzoate 6-hydroxylase n=1 Tax=Fictibacillus arsenicus TaxID=255247 RepID=A0A1B1Z917_9BACL|nr:FAD-dependent monooxygenase [Fictibacillus arsenicus]ANX13926.1 3-hydroxybenzoate 6-hydroxylase [Fictibacillus arsenicus]